MKKLKIACLVVALIPLSGCTGITGLATQLKDDPAVVRAKITTIYGTGELVRVGSNTNSVTIAPDGTVNINPKKE